MAKGLKLQKLTELEWKFVATALCADILDNKVTLNYKVVQEIFCGKNPVDSEDLLALLIYLQGDWDSYIEHAVTEGHEITEELKDVLKEIVINDKILFCRACDFDGLESVFEKDEEEGLISCPECGSLALGVRRQLDKEEE